MRYRSTKEWQGKAKTACGRVKAKFSGGTRQGYDKVLDRMNWRHEVQQRRDTKGGKALERKEWQRGSREENEKLREEKREKQ